MLVEVVKFTDLSYKHVNWGRRFFIYFISRLLVRHGSCLVELDVFGF